jgi:hypothetical protein
VFLEACSSTDNVEFIKKLLAKDADIQARKGQALVNAYMNNQHKLIKFLLQNGVQPAKRQDYD